MGTGTRDHGGRRMQECRAEVERDARYGEGVGLQGPQEGPWRLLRGGRAALTGGGSAPSEGGAKPGASYRWWLLSFQSPAQPATSCVLSSNPTPSADVGDLPGRGFFLSVNSEQMDSSAPSATWLSNT